MTAPASHAPQVAAVVAAAGRSIRMGTAKQMLPWDKGTLLGAVVDHLHQAGAQPVVVVLGHEAESVRNSLYDQASSGSEVSFVLNPEYLAGEMLSSHQAGLRHLQAIASQEAAICGSLLALGDQPHIPPGAIRRIIDHALHAPHAIAIPSYQMRRGHPIYLPASLWTEALKLGTADSLRRLIKRHEDTIQYVEVDTPTVLRDIDTPDDYAALRPGCSAEP